MKNTKLKVGILLDSYDISALSFKMFETIIDSNFAEIVLVILNDNNKTESSNKTLYSKVMNNRSRIGYLLVRKILEKIYSKLIDREAYLPDAEESRNCEELFSNCTVLKVKTKRKKWSDYFYDEDIIKIREHDIDILIRSGFGILRGGILNSAKYGVWSFHHGDSDINRGGPAGYWESMQSWPETGSVLQILTEDLDNGQVLYRSYSCTENMSVKGNKNNYFWKSLSFMTRKMEDLYTAGEKEFFKQVAYENRHPTFYSDRLYTSPTNRELGILTFNKVIEKVKRLYNNKFFLEQWILMFHLKDELSSSLWRYKKIIPPKDRFWADPHILHKGNKYFVFIEEYLYKTQKGHISLITMDENGEYSRPEVNYGQAVSSFVPIRL